MVDEGKKKKKGKGKRKSEGKKKKKLKGDSSPSSEEKTESGMFLLKFKQVFAVSNAIAEYESTDREGSPTSPIETEVVIDETSPEPVEHSTQVTFDEHGSDAVPSTDRRDDEMSSKDAVTEGKSAHIKKSGNIQYKTMFY